MKTLPRPVVSVARLWPGETVVCLGSGPSLTREQVDAVGGLRIIAVNDAVRLAPEADVLYACDAKWWRWHKGVPSFTGVKYALTAGSGQWPGVHVLKNLGSDGLSLDPTGLKTGQNSGYQAINLTVLLGAARILLLGYDMHGTHFFGKHPDGSVPPFAKCLAKFQTLVQPLKKAGVEVINCTPGSALTCFPQRSLADVLKSQSSVDGQDVKRRQLDALATAIEDNVNGIRTRLQDALTQAHEVVA